MRIDAHQHYWAIGRGDYGWITPEIPVLYRDYLPPDLAPHLERHKLAGTVVVQAAPTAEETDFILELAGRTESIVGVVGWLDPRLPDWREWLMQMRNRPKLAGVRIMIQDMEQPDEILEPGALEAFTYLADEGLPVDLLLTADQLDTALALMKRVPHLHGVIDHLAKPRIAAGQMDPWRGQMAELAAYPDLWCKLSGMVTEAAADWNTEDFQPYVRHVLDCFGPGRVMFGSDWPVCLLAGSYGEVLELLENTLPDSCGGADRERLFGLNAAAFYRLPL